MRYFLILLQLLISFSALHGQQSKAANKKLKKARKELSAANYPEAKSLYQEALTFDPNNPDILFETGLAYYNSNVDKERSVEFFENAISNSKDDTIPEFFYYLGRAYHYTQEFEKAVDTYVAFKHFTSKKKDGMLLTRDVDRFIEMCNNGAAYVREMNKDVQIVNIGKKVNSEYAEYTPVVNKNETLLLFTARKSGSTGGNFYHDDKYFEDIYISIYDDAIKEWTWATKFDSSDTYISSKLNSKFHDAAIAYSDNEDKLFIYRENHIWLSELKNGKWTAPIRMGEEINSKGHEPSAFLAADEKTLFIVSDRKEGFGGRDIYFTTKSSDGSWKQLRNLGPVINTRFDEDAPFFMKDGKTLYFSSNGHSTMGGYDVFKSEWNSDSTWSIPENMGAPINSSGDDIYFAPNDNETWAYHSSSRMSGFGDMDLYRIQLVCENLPNTEIRGRLLAGAARLPMGGSIRITDSTGKELGVFPIDASTGNYVLVLPPENRYELELHTPDGPWERERPHKESFYVPKQCEPYALYQEINMRHINSETQKTYAQEAKFYNAMFNAEDSAKTLFQIDAPGTGIDSPEAMMNLAGQVNFNKAFSASGTEVYLLDANGGILRYTKTAEDGTFAFNDLPKNDGYSVALNTDDLKNIYFGISSNNSENGIIARGELKWVSLATGVHELIDSMKVILIDNQKDIVNITHSSVGSWLIDNVNVNARLIESANNDNFITYNLGQHGMDYAISAYIRTIDPETQLNYSEYVDLIPMDTGVTTTNAALIAFENIYFDFDKYFLRDKSVDILDKIYNYMASNPTITIRMDGHCDWMGTDAYNSVLSENRANSAYKYLVKKGIDPSRIDRKWFGESTPAAPNANPDGTDNPEGRQLNRRVEFKITMPDMALTISTY